MVVLMAFVELEVTFSAIAMGVALRTRSRAATYGATALAAAATAAGLGVAWTVWFVAPWCIADPNLLACTAGQVGFGGLVFVMEIAALQWAWMLGVALLARFTAERNAARVAG